jgi:hypothetical protein
LVEGAGAVWRFDKNEPIWLGAFSVPVLQIRAPMSNANVDRFRMD